MRSMSFLKLFLLSSIVLFSCKHTEQSRVKITNGQAAGNQYPEVVEIITPRGLQAGSCTATFVSDSTVITAAHCISDDQGGVRGEIRIASRNGPRATKAFISPKYDGKQNIQAEDLAVIVFPAGTSQKWKNVAKQQPKPGVPITVIGFGNSEHSVDSNGRPNGSGAGTKRIGRNRLGAVDQGALLFKGEMTSRRGGTGENSATSQGDSGGPMFVEDELVGVTSGGYVGGSEKFSVFASIHHPVNMEFIKETMKAGAKIPSLEEDNGNNTGDQEKLFVALGKEESTGTYELYFSGSEKVKSISYCEAKEGKPTLCNDNQARVSTSSREFEVGAIQIFKGGDSVALEGVDGVSVVAFDDQNKIIGTTTVKFQKK